MRNKKNGKNFFNGERPMKQISRVFFFSIVALAFLACNKQEFLSNGNERIVEFSAAPLTKTVFGTASGSTLPTLWTDTYSVAISMNYGSAKKSTKPEVGSGGTTAKFTAEIEAGDATNFAFYAVSPFESYVSASSTYTSIGFEVPTTQTPSSTSPDEKAQIIFGQYDAGSTFPSSVTMSFRHLTSYGRISFANLALAEGESVSSVSLTASEKWAGRYYYYVEDHGDYSAGDFQENSSSNTITITTSSTDDIWFGCAPVDLGGKTVDVVITTDKGTTYSKTITIPTGKKFTSGVVNAFTIDMNGIAPDGAVIYTLVKDVADLTLGSEVIIVADAFDYAISTTQNSNNRGQAGITKSTSTGGEDIVVSPGVDVQVLTIANGNKAGTYAFSTGSGYLYAVSGNNHLKTQQTLDNAGSWLVSISSAGVATIKSVGTNDTRILRYNDKSSLFSCYGSGQNDVLIYKKNGTGSGAITAKVAESLVISGATTSYSVNDTYSFDGTVKLVYSDTSEETLSSSDYTIDASNVNMTQAGTYSVTVSYNADSSIIKSFDITVSGGNSGGSVTVTSSNLGSASTTETEMDSEISYFNSASNTYSNPMRIYSGNTFTISSKTQDITQVVYTCNTEAYATTLSQATFTVDSGASTSVAVSGKDVTVMITGSSKTLAVKLSAQIRLDALSVTYGSSSSGSGGDEETTTQYTFTSKSWGDSSNSWTSGQDAAQMSSGRGVQVTTAASGANATSKYSFSDVSEVVVTYSTNASNGAGSIAIQVGSNTTHSQSVTKNGGTTDRTLTYSISPNESGNVKITVTCTTNSIYVKSVAITHK